MTTKKTSLVSANATLVPCRLPVAPATLSEIGLDPSTWAVLTDSIFPSASTPEGVMLAVRYCQARGLDVMKRPVHVVPMWSKTAGRYVETVWPGISEVQITAARTGLWAGLDSPKFGPEVTKKFAGSVKRDGKWENAEVEVTFPEWAEVTVWRLVSNVRCAFAETVFWEETYARQGRADLPNEMWQKRPRGQLHKCAKAAALRAAFPEEAGYTAEEMEGKAIDGHAPSLSEAVVETAAEAAAESSKQTPVRLVAPLSVVESADAAPAAPSNPTPAKEAIPPTDAGKDAAIAEQVKLHVAKLIERASKSRAWAQAEDYVHARFNGTHLAYALRELERASQTPVGRAR